MVQEQMLQNSSCLGRVRSILGQGVRIRPYPRIWRARPPPAIFGDFFSYQTFFWQKMIKAGNFVTFLVDNFSSPLRSHTIFLNVLKNRNTMMEKHNNFLMDGHFRIDAYCKNSQILIME